MFFNRRMDKFWAIYIMEQYQFMKSYQAMEEHEGTLNANCNRIKYE